MEYNESNFIYLRKTDMEKYYDELVRAEHICEYFPVVTKVIVRKVLEAFLKDIAEKQGIESNVAIWSLLSNIKFSSNFFLPEETYNFIETILVNGYEHASRNNKNKKIPKHPIEILETIHNIICWYLKKFQGQEVRYFSFRAPSTIEYMQKEISTLKEDILLKDNQINNLRQKIIEYGSEAKVISELNNIIIEIKKEKSSLEEVQTLLNKKIQIQKAQVSDMEGNYKTYIKKLEELKKKCNENQGLLFEKESQLVKAEIQNQELKDLIKDLDEQDDSIEAKEHYLEEELNVIRQAYERLVTLTNQYQDILETIEFSYNEELQKILETQKNSIKMEINFEDNIFNENIISYTKNVTEARRKVLIFKGMLNEKFKRDIKHERVFKGFLKLEDKELRIIYTIINSISSLPSLINKSKELLLRSSEDRALTLINKNFEELKNVSDDEIKLILYYKLIKLSQGEFGNIKNRKQFVQVFENVIDEAYIILLTKKDFNGKINKLDAINSYHLEKVIAALRNKNPNIQVHEDLINKIYNKILELRENEENLEKRKIYYDKFDLSNMSEVTLKMSIKAQPFTFLSIMADISDTASYREVSAIIFEIEHLITKRSLPKDNEGNSINSRYINRYFMILIFLYSGATTLSQNQQEELLPLIVMEIMSIDLVSDNDTADLDCYNRMIELWEHKQHRYNDISMEKESEESTLEALINEKQYLETIAEELLKGSDELVNQYNNYKEEFKNIIMNSEKRILLPSYMKYEELRSKKEIAENNLSESKNKHGALKSMFSPEVWKEQANKLINESSMMEAEKQLIEEAKQKPYFQKEYLVFSELEEQIRQTNELIAKNQENLRDKNIIIENMQNKINELQRKLNTMMGLYPDVE